MARSHITSYTLSRMDNAERLRVEISSAFPFIEFDIGDNETLNARSESREVQAAKGHWAHTIHIWCRAFAIGYYCGTDNGWTRCEDHYDEIEAERQARV